MTTPRRVKQDTKSLCKCRYCCIKPLQNSASLDHQNSSSFQYEFATSTLTSLYPYTHFTNPDSLPTLQQSFRSFTASFPQYLTTVESDQIREVHFRHLSTTATSRVCLDYFGHGLFSFSQHGHDHSTNGGSNDDGDEFVASTSATTSRSPRLKRQGFEVSRVVNDTKFKELLEARLMKYLNVSGEDYSMFITTNQTSAFKIVGDSYPFKSNNRLITVYDHENEAVEAIIESAKQRKARVSTAEFKWPKLKIHCKRLEEMLLGNNNSINNVGIKITKSRTKTKTRARTKGLMVFPVQSRVSGAKYSYQWMSIARENGWHVLLDCTSLGPKDMDTLGLSLFQPDILICTFYRVFGHDPSGFTCLLVKRSDPPVLDPSCFSSGRGFVTLVESSDQGTNPGNQIAEQLDEKVKGLNEKCYLEGGDVEIEECDIECGALDHADSLGLALIGLRCRCLVNWLANALLALSHPSSDNDVQLVQVYGPRVRFDRGPALAFNVFDWKGEKLDPLLVQKLGDRSNISLGYGCLKNLWFSERYEDEKNSVMDKVTKDEQEKISKGKKSVKCKNDIAVVTLNLCFLTNFEDVYRVWTFVAKFLDADFVEKERWRYIALNQKTFLV